MSTLNTVQKIWALIPAAGSGSRLGASVPKALFKLSNNKTVIESTLEIFLSVKQLEKIIVLTPIGMIKDFEGACNSLLQDSKKINFIEGGSERQDSVRMALEYCKKISPPEYVLIHDAARFLISTELINAVIKRVTDVEAVTAAIPVVDSLIVSSQAGGISKYLDRANCWQVQTPQAFKFDLIYQAHLEWYKEGKKASDDASLVIDKTEVAIIKGERQNIKLTGIDDLPMMETFNRYGT